MAVTINGTKSTLDVDTYMDELDELAGQARREALLHLPDDFYDARPWTRHIAQKAAHMGMSREALFAAMLAVISSRIPANVKADLTGRDVLMPLNMFVNLSGCSGGGKSRAIGTACRLLSDMTGKVKEFNPASGEAFPAAFVTRAKEDGEWVTKQKTDRALMVCTECSELNQVCSRPGNTIITQIIKAYSGETLGLNTKNEEINLTVGAGQYRLAGVLGVQPANATMFTAGIETGLTGRFIYFYTTDESMADRLDEDMPAPVEPWPDVQLPDGQFPKKIVFPPQARQYVLRLQRKGTAGLVDDVDGHRGENVGRVAALYAIMDGRTAVNMDDWALALRVMDTSDRVRAWLLDKCHSEQVRVEADKVDTREKAKDSVAERRDDRIRNRVLNTLDRHGEQIRLDGRIYQGLTRADLQRRLARDARYATPIIENLKKEEKIIQCLLKGSNTVVYLDNIYDDYPHQLIDAERMLNLLNR